MGRTDLFEKWSEGYWLDLIVSLLVLAVVFLVGSEMVNVEEQPWYLAIPFFMAVFMITDIIMYHVRLLPVLPWRR